VIVPEGPLTVVTGPKEYKVSRVRSSSNFGGALVSIDISGYTSNFRPLELLLHPMDAKQLAYALLYMAQSRSCE
jgi:hypothetical protein